jgi:Protein of unknown function (DUF3558)
MFAVFLLAGCTTADPGTPVPGETATTESTTTTTGVSRPRNIDMAAVDICGVFGALPRASFGLDESRPPLAGDSSVFPGSKDCFGTSVATNLALTLTAVVSQGAAEYVDGANAEISETDVAGFRLYVLTPASPNSCFGVLDVNDGQMLSINYGLGSPGSPPVTPQATLCERVPEIAMAVLTQL